MKIFDRNDMNSKIEFLLNNIKNYDDMSLSTVSPDGTPRSVCVNFDLDENWNIFWKSSSDSLHSQYLESNNHASILIYRAHDDYDFAMYSTWAVRVVTDKEELSKLLKVKYDNKGRFGKMCEQFVGESENRIYLYEIKELFVADKDHKKSEIDVEVLTDRIR